MKLDDGHDDGTPSKIAGPVLVSEREEVGLFAFAAMPLGEEPPVSVDRDGKRPSEVDDVDGRSKVDGLV